MSTVAPKSGDKPSCSLCQRIGLRPFTKQNVLFYYAPLHSLFSYGGLAINVMNPSLAVKLIAKKDVTNFLLIHTMLGASLYLYSRPHLQSVDPKKRIAYSVLGSALFGLGSVLAWAIIRSAVPRNNALSTALGVATGYAIARLAYDYLDHVDSKAIKSA